MEHKKFLHSIYPAFVRARRLGDSQRLAYFREKATEVSRHVLENDEEVIAAVIWGSVSRGDIMFSSDVDILAVTKHTNRVVSLDWEVPVEISYRPVDFLRTSPERGEWWFVEAIKTGVVLFDRESIIDKMKNEFKDIKVISIKAIREWITTARAFLSDAEDLSSLGEDAGAVVNARYGAEASIMALLLARAVLNPSPKRILPILRSCPDLSDLTQLFLSIAGVASINRKETISILSKTKNLLTKVSKQLVELGVESIP